MSKKLPTKRPTAEKRQAQNEKRQRKNRAFKARVGTASRRVRESLENENATPSSNTQGALNRFYSLVDKGVQKGVFPKNKAARMKAKQMKLLKNAK